MGIGKLYQSIFRRKSVRSYETLPLEAAATEEITSFIPGLSSSRATFFMFSLIFHCIF